MSTALVRLEKVTKIYGTDDRRTAGVREVSFQANEGELIVILGPSGSGKTTLLKLIAGFVRPTSGTVLLFNRPLGAYTESALQTVRAGELGFIFQTFRLINALSVFENIALVIRFAAGREKKRYLQAEQILKEFGIEHLAGSFPGQLSQGEKQRVAIARAVVNDARLILADEPTASLGAEQGIEIIHLLHTYAHTAQKCVLVASHDLRLKAYADRIIRIEDGVICN